MSIADKACIVGGGICDHIDIRKKIRGKGGLRAGAGGHKGRPSAKHYLSKSPNNKEVAYEIILVPLQYDVWLMAPTGANDNKKRGELQ